MIKLTTCLIIGIVLAHYLNLTFLEVTLLTSTTLLIFVIIYIISQNRKRKTVLFGIITYIIMISIGLLTYHFNDQINWSGHYTKTDNIANTNTYELQIIERLKPGRFHEKYIIKLLSINHRKCSGKLLLNIKKDSTNSILKTDNVYLISSKLNPINPPLNPHQFDYKNYLKRQYIYHQLTVPTELLIPIPTKQRSIVGYASQIRNQINHQLKSYHFNNQQLAIINALFLGQRQDLDRQLYENYVKAGAIHILAISGLHVGIFLMMLNQILTPLEYFKNGRLIKAIIILILLWSFAVIAGLSASVTRAVTMFSIFTVAMHLKRPTNVYNTLAISIFMILIVKPMFLFDVGFQMSYVAVLAIVSIQPELYKLWTPKFKTIDYLCQIFTVTIAAQLGVAPLSLFYFHQFPGLFFLSNMAIIPFLGFILGFGMFVIILASIELLPIFLASAFGRLIDAMNAIIKFVSSKEQFILKDISFEFTELISAYLILVLLFGVVKLPNSTRIRKLLYSLLAIQVVFLVMKLKEPQDRFIIFHKSRKTLLGFHRQDQLKVWHDLDTLQIQNSKEIQDYCIANYITIVNYDSLQNVYKTEAGLIMVIDSLGVYNVNHFSPQYILLRNSPKINLSRLIDSIQPIQIIADGSNYKSYVQRWKATCIKEKLPFHSTYEKGAYIFK